MSRIIILWLVVGVVAGHASSAAAAAGGGGGGTSSDDEQFAKAKEECAPQLAGLGPCLAYVGGSAKTPTMDCCTGMKQVLASSKKCVCLLVKYKDDPSLGFKFDVNRALGLPGICHSPAKLNECPALLHLSPNSTDSKMFENYDKTTTNATSTATPAVSATATATPATTSSDSKPNGSCRSLIAAAAVFYGVIVAFL